MKRIKAYLSHIISLVGLIVLAFGCSMEKKDDALIKKMRAENSIQELDYENIPNSYHMVIVETSTGELLTDREKIESYNKGINQPDLRTNKVYISGKNIPIIGIRTFMNLNDAQDYVRRILKSEVLDKEKVIPISGDNYRRLLANKDLVGYWEFYESNISK